MVATSLGYLLFNILRVSLAIGGNKEFGAMFLFVLMWWYGWYFVRFEHNRSKKIKSIIKKKFGC